MAKSTTAKRPLGIGDVVLFYEQADDNTIPVPAVIQQITSDDVFNLTLIPYLHRELLHKKGVRKLGSPEFKNPLAKQGGAWDTVDAGNERIEEAREAEIVRAREAQQREQQRLAFNPAEEDVLRVLEMHANRLDPGEIAAKMGMPWTFEHVRRVLREADAVPA